MKQNNREEREMTNEERAVIEAADEFVQWMSGSNTGILNSSRLIDAVMAWRAAPATPPGPEPGTREVRIAVVIGSNGITVVTDTCAHRNDVRALAYAHQRIGASIVAQGIVKARIPVIALPVVTVTGIVEAV